MEMAQSDPRPEEITTTEARAGYTPHMTRNVLTLGLILVVVIFALIVLVGRS